MKSNNPILRPHRLAFSLVEVLFAVMILGIGFIMVAAIFPVGIQQGRDAIDDTTGRTIARDAANRAAAGFRCINDDPNLQALATLCNGLYRWVDSTSPYQLTIAPTTVTNGTTGTVGGGKLTLFQSASSDWKYLGQDQYLSQLFFLTRYNNVTKTGTLNLMAIAMRDGRDPLDQTLPLGIPAPPAQRVYVRQCQILTDGKANIYSDLYIQGAFASAGMTDPDIAAFLGTNGAIVTVSGGIIRMQDSGSTLKGSTPPAPKTWADPTVVDAYMFSSDIPVIGSYTLTTSLP